MTTIPTRNVTQIRTRPLPGIVVNYAWEDGKFLAATLWGDGRPKQYTTEAGIARRLRTLLSENEK